MKQRRTSLSPPPRLPGMTRAAAVTWEQPGAEAPAVTEEEPSTLDAFAAEQQGDGAGGHDSSGVALIFAAEDGEGALDDADRATALYESDGLETEVVKGANGRLIQQWLSIGGWGLGAGDGLALYYAGAMLPAQVQASFEATSGVAAAQGVAVAVGLDMSPGMQGDEATATGPDAALGHALLGSSPGRDATQGSTISSASAGALDPESFTQELLALAALSPTTPLDQLAATAVDRDQNEGGIAQLGSEQEVTGSRLALVVGNNAYEWSRDLPGARRDAAQMAGLLQGRGYEVGHHIDQTGADLFDLFTAAGGCASAGDEIVMYYAGHGARNGDLVGVDGEQVPLGIVTRARDRAQASGAKATLVLDSCYSDKVASDEGLATGDRPEASKGPPAGHRSGLQESLMKGWFHLEMEVERLQAHPDLDAMDHVEADARELSLRAETWGPPLAYIAPDASRSLPVRSAYAGLTASLDQLRETVSAGERVGPAQSRGLLRALHSAGEVVDADVPHLDTVHALIEGDPAARETLTGAAGDDVSRLESVLIEPAEQTLVDAWALEMLRGEAPRPFFETVDCGSWLQAVYGKAYEPPASLATTDDATS